MIKKSCVCLAISGVMAMGLVAPSFAADQSFKATITLLEPITVQSGSDLSFEPTVIGTDQSVVTFAESTRAAVFSASGSAGASVVASVVEESIELTTGGANASSGEVLVVDQFTYGGSLNLLGEGEFDASGQLSDMRVGGTANVAADNVAGDYEGDATFRVTYY